MSNSKPSVAKILTIDIETSPNVADVWRLFGEQYISLSQLKESTRMICFAAKWYGKDEVIFRSEFHHGTEKMLAKAYELIDEADIVIHYNGKNFDMPHLFREFLLGGFSPPSPVQEIDLYKEVKARFKFPSNKLQYIATALGLKGKQEHEGHELWVKCMARNRGAWKDMKSYNVQDTIITEQVYDKLRAWLKIVPHLGLYSDEDGCPRCGGTSWQKRGTYKTPTLSYQRFRCNGCGSWSRSKKSVVAKTEKRAIV